MRDGIDWIEVGSGGRFEKIVSVLLSTLHPDSERIDGAGGDGGRDHQLRDGNRLHLWQSKYFCGRLSDSRTRKRQITESLTAATTLDPDSWTLVTPMVPNPHELSWFDGLKKDHPFPLRWRGGDWLDARLADHPAIVRHFTGANDGYIALLRELREEQDALIDGLPAATPRIEQLAAKINNSNPFYKVDFTVEDGRIATARLRPQYRGAERDSPATIRFTVVTGPADAEMEERLRSALDWGDAAELPTSHVRNIVISGPPGFAATHDEAGIAIGPAAHEPIDVSLRMVIHTPAGRQVAALPAQLVTRTAGLRGVTLHGRDLAGVVEARLRLDRVTSQFSLSLSSSWARPLLPGAALPIFRFLQYATPPNTLTFGLGKDALSTTPVILPAGMAISEKALRFVEDLDRVQAAAGEAFPVPRYWTVDDQAEVHRAIRLLDGHRVDVGRGPVRFEMEEPYEFIEAVQSSQRSSMAITSGEPYLAHIAGHELNLGPYTLYIKQPELESPSATPAPDGTNQLSVAPRPGFGIQLALGQLIDRPDGPRDSA